MDQARGQAQNNRDIFYIFKITFFRYTRGRGQRPKKRIMHFLRLANEQTKMPGGKTTWNFHKFPEDIFFDIIEVLAKNRKYVLCIFGGWPMDRDENASRWKILKFAEISGNGLFRHNRGPVQKPKTRIMHFVWLANRPWRKCLEGIKSRIFQNFLEIGFFDIIEVLAKNRKHVSCILKILERQNKKCLAANKKSRKWNFEKKRNPISENGWPDREIPLTYWK